MGALPFEYDEFLKKRKLSFYFETLPLRFVLCSAHRRFLFASTGLAKLLLHKQPVRVRSNAMVVGSRQRTFAKVLCLEQTPMAFLKNAYFHCVF